MVGEVIDRAERSWSAPLLLKLKSDLRTDIFST